MDRDGATAIQAYFNAIGIQANIDIAEAARLSTILTGPYTGIIYHQLRPFSGFNANLLLEFGSPVSTFYKSLKKPDGWQAIFDAALRSEKEEPSLMQKANRALYDDCTMIPVYNYSSIYVTQTMSMTAAAPWVHPRNFSRITPG
jgi:ABC-type transport system substrate-binding protein